ncbi:MAG: ABC transporter ATP-binding protein [Candidatus Bathyarchaeota archaeon]|nr:ABC transporter ATP-binding protein [Candidatus Bathyarchaeota archaeon]
MVEIILKNLTKRFGDVTAADNINLTINDGEFFTLLGPSGCGKTTTMRMIAGLEFPTEGQVFFDDKDVTQLPSYERNTGMVFQNYALWPHMKVFENVAYGLNVRKVPQNEIKERVKEALEQVKLGGMEDRFPTQLSGGQQQRVALARVLVINPAVLLLDEPLSNLDAKLRVQMREEIKDLQKRLGITTIYVTHDQEEAMSVSDRIAIQNHGRVMQIGDPLGIYNVPQNVFIATFMGRGTLLEGDVTSIDPDVSMKIGNIELTGNDSTGNIKAGDRASCIIRPDSYEVKQPDVPSNVMEGLVEWTSFIGPYTEVRIDVDGNKILVDVPPEFTPEVGGTLKVYIPYKDTIMLPLDVN